MADSNFIHRTNETILGKSDAFVQAMGLQNRTVVNPGIGDISGWSHNIFDYLNVQPHIQQQTWCVMLSTPAIFSRLPGGAQLHSMCKSFFENRSLKFEGLSDQTQYEFAEVAWTGHRLSFPSGATRTLGQVNHSTYDLEGEPFRYMFEAWGNWAMMNPDTQFPNAVILNDPGDLLLDDIGASAIYFETTRNGKAISSSQLIVGMMPEMKVGIQMRRDKNEAGQMRMIDMPFRGLVESNTRATKQIAEKMLSRLSFYNPGGADARPAFMNRTAILEGIKDSGVIETMASGKARVSAPNYIA